MASIKKNQSKLRGARLIIKEEGVLSLVIRSLQKVQKVQQRKSSHKVRFRMLADEKDMIAAEWVNAAPVATKAVNTPCTLAWVMSPPGESGGGHQNIFRFIKFLDAQGYRNIVHLYSTSDFPTTELVRERIRGFYDIAPENLRWLDNENQEIEGDAVFATGWETAYPVYNSDKSRKKFYFVQDFEPLFYPMGSEYIMAENTYKFGFTGITAGKWLTQKLHDDYGMHCQYYDFGAEPANYQLTNLEKRKEIFFYARPITTRRGFELGIMTLHKFHQKHPDYIINLAGWDVSEYNIPFPYVNHKAMRIDQLSELYNRCAAALVISLTNMSLLPLELLATGTIPVVNDAPNNRLVSDNAFIKYAIASPDALAEALHEVVSQSDPVEISKQAAASVTANGWEKSGEKFVSIVEEELHG